MLAVVISQPFPQRLEIPQYSVNLHISLSRHCVKSVVPVLAFSKCQHFPVKVRNYRIKTPTKQLFAKARKIYKNHNRSKHAER